MDNKINFTGIQNMGGLAHKAIDGRDLKPIFRKYLVAQLSDDFYGKDFSKYRKAVDSCREVIGENRFPYEPSFIHIMTDRFINPEESPKLLLNSKVIPVNDKTLKLYDFLAKFTRTLKKMNPKDYVAAEDFKFGPDGDLFIMGDANISDFCRSEKNYVETTNKIYCADMVKRVASAINDDIQRIMEKYFDV